MSVSLIALFVDIIGLICFTIAYHYSFKNYQAKRPSEHIAGIYCTSMGIGILLFTALAFIVFGLYAELFDIVYSYLLTFMVGLLTVLVLVRSY